MSITRIITRGVEQGSKGAGVGTVFALFPHLFLRLGSENSMKERFIASIVILAACTFAGIVAGTTQGCLEAFSLFAKSKARNREQQPEPASAPRLTG